MIELRGGTGRGETVIGLALPGADPSPFGKNKEGQEPFAINGSRPLFSDPFFLRRPTNKPLGWGPLQRPVRPRRRAVAAVVEMHERRR